MKIADLFINVYVCVFLGICIISLNDRLKI